MIILLILYKKHFPFIQAKWLMIVFVLLLGFIGTVVEPKPIYDLYRHYEMIENIRNSSYSLIGFLKEGYHITDFNYMYTYVYNIIIYTIAKLLPRESLPFIAIIVTYGIFVYITVDELGQHLPKKKLLLSVAIFSILMQYLYVYSNIRSPLAGAIISYGLYRYCKYQKKLVLLICLFVAILIHPMFIIIIPFVIFRKCELGIKEMLMIIALPFAIFQITEQIRLNLGLKGFLFKIAAKYYNYTMVRTDNQGRVFLYSIIIILMMICVLALCKSKRCYYADEEQSLFNLIICYSMFSLMYYQSYSMMLRLPQSIACLMSVAVNRLFDKNSFCSDNMRFIVLFCEFIILGLTFIVFFENIAWLI